MFRRFDRRVRELTAWGPAIVVLTQ